MNRPTKIWALQNLVHDYLNLGSNHKKAPNTHVVSFPTHISLMWQNPKRVTGSGLKEQLERKKPLNLRGNPGIKERETLSNSQKKETNNIIGEKIKRYTRRAFNSLARNSEKRKERKIMETLLYSTFLPFFFFLFYFIFPGKHLTLHRERERERERTSIIVLF